MIYIGIDPGAKGALALIYSDGRKPDVFPFESESVLKNILYSVSDEDISRCSLERVSAMPKQGVTSMFNFGMNYGFIQGLLTAYSIPYELVTPQKWKKEFQITGDKNNSIAVCKRLFPDVDLRRTERCRKDDDGMAEALLLACYAQRRM